MARDFRDCVRLDWLKEIQAGLLGRADRRATGRLGAVDLIVRLVHQTELDEFLVALMNLRQQRARRHADDGVGRDAPAGLFEDFKAHILEPSA